LTNAILLKIFSEVLILAQFSAILDLTLEIYLVQYLVEDLEEAFERETIEDKT